MKFSFESHDEDGELYLPIPAFRYEQLIECESCWESLKGKMMYDYRHDANKDYETSYHPLAILQMMGAFTTIEKLEGERNAAENQKSED